MDLSFGNALPDHVARTELVDVGHAGHATIEHGGGPYGQQAIDAYELILRDVPEATLPPDVWDLARATWMDPDYRWISPINFGVWGQRPA